MWHAQNQKDLARINRTVVDVFRCIHGSDLGPPEVVAVPKSDAEVIAELGILSPNNRTLYARIRLFALINSAPRLLSGICSFV